MGNLKFARDLFLETEEMNRFRKFIFEEGIRLDFKNKIERLGIVYNEKYDPNFTYFKPTATGVDDTVKIAAGYAYNIDANVLRSLGVNIVLPQRNVWYWLKIRYKYTNVEVGTVSIGGANGGLLTGLGTKFTEVLRGQPNFPAKIKLQNSLNYTLEYEVNEVVNDTTAYLQGSFPVFEQELKYAVVGTFTPGVYPTEVDKYPLQYDDFDYELVSELSLNTPPDLIDDYEFFVCRVISRAEGVEVQDKRRDFICKTRGERIYNEVPNTNNPLIAIESITKKIIRTNLFYVVRVGVGFVINSENRNTNLNKVIITAGAGGRYKTTTAFATGDFDGWRYYYQDGDYSRIISSVKVGSTIELIVDCLKHDIAGAMVCPPTEEIEFKLQFYNEDQATVYKTRLEKVYSYTPVVDILISENELVTGTTQVGINSRCKTVFRLGPELSLNINTYQLQDVGNVTSNVIRLAAAPGDGGSETQTAWRGINLFCELETIDPDIYFELEERNSSTDTEWFPNDDEPSNSTVREQIDLYAKFYSDSGLTTPYSFTKSGLNVYVKRVSEVTQTFYNTLGSPTVNNRVIEYVEVYTVNVAGADEVLLSQVYKEVTERQHITLDPDVHRVIYEEVNTWVVFPTAKIYAGRTGRKGFTDLEEYFILSGLPTGLTKPNIESDPDYIAPVSDFLTCSLIIPSFALNYSYALNIQQVTFTASSATRNGAVITNTEAGGYTYVLQQFNTDEDVTVQVRATSLGGGNTSGMIWVRITWRNSGDNFDTVSQTQIPNNTLTSIPGTFKNIKQVNISNF